MPYPKELGQPCWQPEQVRKVISLTAHTSSESAPYFLAAHSPFARITDVKAGGRQLTEEQAFAELFSPARGEVQAFVRGEPGTGKSHLIRWLKLRADHAQAQREAGFESFKLVLVSRGNGSLKDALGQVVEQLGPAFRQHTARIRGAIDKLSDQAARDTLLSALALEIGTHWPTRHPEMPLPVSLQHLAAALGPSTGFGAWMKRDGGVIHRVIQRLTQESSVEDREDFPAFAPTDFSVANKFLRPNDNPGNVIAFAEDLAEEDDRRALAATTLNTALADAVRGLTGLRGSDLLEIFTEIRRELGPQKQLAVFIEDVSVTGIDQDIINAFEPREIDGLGRMVAVLGITNSAWDSTRFPDNQKQRATFVFEVGGQVAESWAADSPAVAAFTARYLNAVRTNDEGIRSLAEERFSEDVTRSVCDNCPVQKECFQVFEYSELPNGVKIGLFPLNPVAPKALLGSLNDAYYKSQRGLLDRVLLPALDQSYSALQAHEFPQQNQFSVKAPAFRFDWTGFSARYLGGARWTDPQKNRIRFLAGYWANAATAGEAAARLTAILAPLGLPKFSSEAAPTGPRPTDGPSGPQPPTPPPPPPDDSALQDLLKAVDSWFDGSKLTKDADFRKMVGSLLRKSIAWPHQRGTPITVSVTGEGRFISGHAFVRIEGQTSNPANQPYFIELARNEETRDLLQSLSHFERRGSWDFPHGELHKRKISRWLRRHQPRVIESLRPDPSTLVQSALQCAIQSLAVAAALRDRRKLPADAAERIEALFESIWDPVAKPVILSDELQEIAADLETRHASLRGLLVREFGAGQGDAAPSDFIDPTPILEVLKEYETSPSVAPPPPQVGNGFWKARFSSVSRMEAYATLRERLEKERLFIERAVEAVRAFATAAGFAGDNLREALGECLKELVEVIRIQRGGQHNRGILPLAHEAFDTLWQKGVLRDSDVRNSWGAAIGKAIDVSAERDPASLLAFNPARLKECIATLRSVELFLELVEKHMEDEESDHGVTGDSRAKLLEALQQIENLAPGDSPETANDE